MTARVWPTAAVTGSPTYDGRALRQTTVAPYVSGATTARPLGARNGVRPGTPTTTVTATTTTWSVAAHAGLIDAEAANEAGPYTYSFDAVVSGAMTAANATNPRIDVVYVRIDDPAESDGTSTPLAAIGYQAGTAAPSPVAPTVWTGSARSMVLAQINVPVSGGGSPSVVWVAPTLIAPGGITPATSAAFGSGTYVGQYIDDAALGLLRWSGSAWVVVSRTDNTGWVAPTLLNGWANFGSGFRPTAYRRINGEVEIRGTVKSGTGVIFNLPAGFRPGADEACITLSNVGGADLRVASPVTTSGLSAGDVSVAAYLAGGNNGIVSLVRPPFTADA